MKEGEGSEDNPEVSNILSDEIRQSVEARTGVPLKVVIRKVGSPLPIISKEEAGKIIKSIPKTSLEERQKQIRKSLGRE